MQVSYPGVYVDEFTPGGPIEGAGTSTAAFVGTALGGPIGKPTLIQSWDAFKATFGGFIGEAPAGHLASAVYGFFLNGGTACYVVRAGTGEKSSVDLAARAGDRAALVAEAIEEGPVGDAVKVEVADSSRLASALGRGSTLKVAHAEANVASLSSDRDEIVVSDNSGFAPGDRVSLSKEGSSATAMVERLEDTDKIHLKRPVPGDDDFDGGTVRVADLTPGQRGFRLAVPSDLRLNQALPRGTLVRVAGGEHSALHTVESSGGDWITLATGLSTTLAMDDAAKLPEFASLEFDITVSDAGEGTEESFEGLSMHPEHPGYWARTVTSERVSLSEPEGGAPEGDPRPKTGSYVLAGGTEDDRAAAWAEVATNPHKFLDPLKAYEEIAIVSVPGATDPSVQQAVISHCESTFSRFGILDSRPRVAPGNGIRDQFTNVRSAKGFAALYYPWILARNPLTGQDEHWPPSGHIAGIFARTDAQHGVHKAPANTAIRGALGLERRLTDEEQGPLNLAGINVLRVFPGRGQPQVWGARTTAGDMDRNWQYITTRRLFLYLEGSIKRGIDWALFEPNNRQLWQKLKRSINEFLTRVWRTGALFGATAEEAFYVRIDEALNPPSTQATGRLYVEIGVRPTYPAEFIVLRIGIWHGGAEVSEG